MDEKKEKVKKPTKMMIKLIEDKDRGAENQPLGDNNWEEANLENRYPDISESVEFQGLSDVINLYDILNRFT